MSHEEPEITTLKKSDLTPEERAEAVDVGVELIQAPLESLSEAELEKLIKKGDAESTEEFEARKASVLAKDSAALEALRKTLPPPHGTNESVSTLAVVNNGHHNEVGEEHHKSKVWGHLSLGGLGLLAMIFYGAKEGVMKAIGKGGGGGGGHSKPAKSKGGGGGHGGGGHH